MGETKILRTLTEEKPVLEYIIFPIDRPGRVAAQDLDQDGCEHIRNVVTKRIRRIKGEAEGLCIVIIPILRRFCLPGKKDLLCNIMSCAV